MAIASLAGADLSGSDIEVDVCIIGAGAAGLYLARRIGTAGHSVLVLESGPAKTVSPDIAGFVPEFTGEPYPAATEGRAFGLGGTTARWGGQLVPYRQADAARDVPAHAQAWAHLVRINELHGGAVLDVLGLRHDDVDSEVDRIPLAIGAGMATAGLDAHASRWLPFSRRNFAWMIQQGRGQRDRVTVVCDATAKEWELEVGDNGRCRIAGVSAVSESGQRIRVRASHCVIAAGAIESPRILQEIDSAPVAVIPKQAAVGRYLSDHLSFKVGEIDEPHRARITDAFGPFFESRQMRSWRFVDARPDPAAPRFFAHFLFALDNPGFNLARTVLQDLQARRVPAVGAAEILAGCAGLARLAWVRAARSRLFIPPGTPVGLQVDMEQRPNASNRVILGQAIDRHGRRVARVQWTISDEDHAEMQVLGRGLLSRWMRAVPGLPAMSPFDFQDPATKPHGAYHPVGTCRLGDDVEAVVDEDLRVRGTTNLHVLSTAVLPSAGTANPTFGLLCLAEMLATNLKEGIDA